MPSVLRIRPRMIRIGRARNAARVRLVLMHPIFVHRPATRFWILRLGSLDVALHAFGLAPEVAKSHSDPEEESNPGRPSGVAPVAPVEPVPDPCDDEDRENELDPHTPVPAHVFPRVRHWRLPSHIMRLWAETWGQVLRLRSS